MADKLFSQENLAKHFNVDPSSPSGLRFKKHRCKCFIGKPAGWLFRPKHTENYGPLWQVSLQNRKTYAHRVIWTIINGSIPKGMQIDHINGVPSDNRIENLSLKTGNENQWARTRLSAHNTSGFNGVSYRKDMNRWQAQVTRNGDIIFKEYFKTATEAGAAVDAASIAWAQETKSDFRLTNFPKVNASTS